MLKSLVSRSKYRTLIEMSWFMSSNLETCLICMGNDNPSRLSTFSYLLYCQTRSLSRSGSYKADRIAHTKHFSSELRTFTRQRLSAKNFGVGMYVEPTRGLYGVTQRTKRCILSKVNPEPRAVNASTFFSSFSSMISRSKCCPRVTICEST